MIFDIYVSDNYDKKLENLLEKFVEDPIRIIYMEKLADAFMDHLQRGEAEWGSWGQDDKRPFGNSSVEYDLAEILDLEMPSHENKDDYEDMKYLLSDLYNDLGVFLRYKWLEFRKIVPK